jgi:CheY-like chemotaxis protein
VAKAVYRVLTLDCDVVESIADGSQVLEAAQRRQPDVIVVDINLPNVNGLECMAELVQPQTLTAEVARQETSWAQRLHRSAHERRRVP